MKTSLTTLSVSGILALFSLAANAQTDPTTTVPNSTPTTTVAQPGAPAAVTPPVDLSAGAKEVLKLQQAGTAPEVVKGYAETAGHLYNLSADDILYMNKVGVPSDTISAMLESDRVTHARQSLQAMQS